VPNIKTAVGVQHGHDMATGNCLSEYHSA
jgi:hypothetical protein